MITDAFVIPGHVHDSVPYLARTRTMYEIQKQTKSAYT